ncbi:hypothetical protein D3C75_895090 [compost metagenome]
MEWALVVEFSFFVGDRLQGLLLLRCPEHDCPFGGSVGRVVVQISTSLLGGGTTAPLGEHLYGDASAASHPVE